jgi:hypothetical protein
MANIFVKSGHVFASLLPVFVDSSRDKGNYQHKGRGEDVSLPSRKELVDVPLP